MQNIFLKIQKLDLFRFLDIYLMKMLIKKSLNDYLLLTIMYCSYLISKGHSCLPIHIFEKEYVYSYRDLQLLKLIIDNFGKITINYLRKLLITSSIIGDGSYLTPFVFKYDKLYLQYMWNNECIIAEFFSRSCVLIKYSKSKIRRILNYLFPQEFNIDWQKISIAVSLTSKISFISGGPGTGKTYVIMKLLISIFLLYEQQIFYVAISAPTGKAVSRLNESIFLWFRKYNLDHKKNFLLHGKAVTLHKLLGYNYYDSSCKYNVDNKLSIDFLIIDESSMLDISIMSSLILALSDKAQVVFLGDYNQLPSIKPGSILRDIFSSFAVYYDNFRCQELYYLTNYKLFFKNNKRKHLITNYLCLLYKNYRFGNQSNIHKLAYAINNGNVNETLSLLNNNFDDIIYCSMCNCDDYNRMINDCVFYYSSFYKSVLEKESPDVILRNFNQYRLLCVFKDGVYGTREVNKLIERKLFLDNNKNVLYFRNNNYVGKPIMILENSSCLNLNNGDIGVMLLNSSGDLRAYFFCDNEIINVSINRLPKYEICFAMTIHKSQGSEFFHTAVLFPDVESDFLTRELFYTAVTRSSNILSLYSSKEIILYLINNPTIRYSGLIDKMYI